MRVEGYTDFRYSNMSLGVILMLCPFSAIAIVGFLLGCMTCLATDSWLCSRCWACGVVLKSNKKAVGYLHNVCHCGAVGHIFPETLLQLQGSQLGETED